MLKVHLLGILYTVQIMIKRPHIHQYSHVKVSSQCYITSVMGIYLTAILRIQNITFEWSFEWIYLRKMWCFISSIWNIHWNILPYSLKQYFCQPLLFLVAVFCLELSNRTPCRYTSSLRLVDISKYMPNLVIISAIWTPGGSRSPVIVPNIDK